MWRAALVLGILFSFSTTLKAQEKFTAASVLTWEEESQDWYFKVSIGMAAIIASQNDETKARCINDWYLKDSVQRRRINQVIREMMRRFSDYRPDGVLLALIERECGELIFKN